MMGLKNKNKNLLEGGGKADLVSLPRVPRRPGGVALPWAELICPFGAHRINLQ